MLRFRKREWLGWGYLKFEFHLPENRTLRGAEGAAKRNCDLFCQKPRDLWTLFTWNSVPSYRKKIFSAPQHPYTQGLIGSLPHKSTKNIKQLRNIPGTPPDGLILSKGCSFAPRCSLAIDRCHFEIPLLKEFNKDHHVACWLRD